MKARALALAAAAVFGVVTWVHAAEWDYAITIAQLQMADDGRVWIYSTMNHGCGGNVYELDPAVTSEAARGRIYAMALTAKVTGSPVNLFFTSCNVPYRRFTAIWMQ